MKSNCFNPRNFDMLWQNSGCARIPGRFWWEDRSIKQTPARGVKQKGFHANAMPYAAVWLCAMPLHFSLSEALEQSPSWALDPRTSPRDFEAWKKSFDQKNCKQAVWQVYVWPSGMDDPLEPQSRYSLFHRLGREWSTRSRYRFHVDCLLAYGVCSHKTYCRSRNPANVYWTYYIQHVYMYFTVYYIQYWCTTNTQIPYDHIYLFDLDRWLYWL